LLGFLVFAEFPDVWIWTGGALIFGSIVWLSRLETRANRR